MPKSIPVVPDEVFRPGAIHFNDIPVNTYDRSIAEESARFSPDDLVHIWRDMCAIREFETILNEIKTKGAYKGVTYNHAGPAHLSIGQEAAAVGMAYSLSPRTTSSAHTAATARSSPRGCRPSAGWVMTTWST